jgi:hypothetical protein
MSRIVLTLLGVGAMASPRHRPAGLLVEHGRRRVAVDGGDGAPAGRLDAWLVSDDRAELMPRLRRLARGRGVPLGVMPLTYGGLDIAPRPVVHTSHPAWGYLICGHGWRVVWAPEFWVFPDWAAGADLMFAEAAGWRRAIRFRGGVGGHAPAVEVAEQARLRGVRRLVLAHLGRPTLRAVDRGERPPFGEFGRDGQRFVLQPRHRPG